MSETPDLPPDLVFLQTLTNENDYKLARVIGGGRYACIAPFGFTTAIITGRIGDFTGMDNRWCYHSLVEAILAIELWAGTGHVGEPEGWHRNPRTGRRRAEDDGTVHFDQDGNVVPVGTIYVRW